MKEYCIYCIWNGGRPFILDTFKTLDSAKLKLYDMVSLEEERERPYYVDNDFFKKQIHLRGKIEVFLYKRKEHYRTGKVF